MTISQGTLNVMLACATLAITGLLLVDWVQRETLRKQTQVPSIWATGSFSSTLLAPCREP